MLAIDPGGKSLLFVISLALLVPCGAAAGTDCHVIEYPDHYEAVCKGDQQRPSPPQRTSAQAAMPEQGGVPTTFAAQAAAQEPQRGDADTPTTSPLPRKYRESWLKAQPHP